MSELKSYAVWDAGTRWFHWINVICVFALMFIGTIILNDGAFGVSTDGKILLKQIHTFTGYAFVLNLVWRFIWAFRGNRYARWGAILPGGSGYLQSVRHYIATFMSGQPEQYVGHNPAGRLAVLILFILLTAQAITGLVLAGTDLFYPPFGYWIAQWVAAAGIPPETLLPYAREMYDAQAYESMRAFRKPFITVHEYAFFVLCFVTVVHIGAVVLTEIKEGGSLISAMFSGRKVLSQKPLDEPGYKGEGQ